MTPRYSVSKRFTFCYGHRLLDYDGNCAHPHGHNARVEVELAGPLDRRGMVVDFNDLRTPLRGWVDANLDHRMILKRGDPLIAALERLGEPVHVMEGNPTAENLARLVFEQGRAAGLAVVRIRFWETDNNCATYSAPEQPAQNT